MLRIHMDEFRSEILGELTPDDIMLLLGDSMEFGWRVKERLNKWIDEYFETWQEAYEEEQRMRIAHDKERI